MGQHGKYPQEMRERAVRMVQEHRSEHESEWAACNAIASKLGMTAETLRDWLHREQIDAGERAGLTTDEREQLKELQRKNRDLKRANEILKSASAFFARELDPQPRKQ